jgi:NAD(P)-dependent dehydrogenase (short-subunit alcohol dehydrogenase family)
MEFGLEGKIAIVTGASRGIGAAIAVELAREGCDVALAARSQDGLEATSKRIEALGRRALVHVADLREENAPEALVDAALGRFGRLDTVVCNAGATKRGDFLALSEEDWADGYALKFTAHRRLARAAWPHLSAAKGSITFIVGVGGRTPGAEFTIGGSVNAALLSLAKALTDKGIEDGVRINAINPGAVATDRLKTRIRALAQKLGISEDEARGRMVKELNSAGFGEPEDIAALVAFATGQRGRFLNGAIIDMDGGQTKTL